MNVIGEAFVEILPTSGKFAANLHKDVVGAVAQTEKDSAGAFDGLAKIGQAAFFAIGTAAVSFGTLAVKAALEGEAAHANLENALENVGSSIKALGPGLETEVTQFAKLGFTNEELEAGLARMVITTGNANKALHLMGIAADVAKAAHKDLESASLAVGKVAEGNLKPLKGLGIVIQSTGDASKDAEAGLAALADRFGGAAGAQADTFAGKLAAMRAQVHNLEESVGNALLPVLASFAGELVGLVEFFERNRVAAVVLATVISTVLVPALSIYIAQQAIAFGESVFDNISSIAGAVKGLGSTFGATGGASQFLVGGGIVAGIAAIAGGTIFLADKMKVTEAQIDAASQALIDLSKGQGNINDVFEKAGINWKQAKYGLDQYMQSAEHANAATQRHASDVNNLGSNFDGLDKALAKLVKSGDSDLAARNFQVIADKTGYTTAQLKAAPGAFNDYKKALRESKEALDLHKAALDQNNVSLAAAKDATGPLADTLRELSSQTGTSTEILGALAKKLGLDLVKGGDDAAAALEKAADRLKIADAHTLILSDSMAILTDNTSDAKDKMNAFKSALDAALGIHVPEQKAISDLYASLDALSKLKVNKGNLNPVTEEGRDDLAAVNVIFDNIKTHLESIQARPHTNQELQNALAGDIEKFREYGKQAGLSADQVQDLINQQQALSPQVQMVITADTSAAQKSLDILAAKIAALTHTNTGNGIMVTLPDNKGGFGGGGLKYSAVGGVYTSPTVSVFGEDGPEAILPLTKPAAMQRVLNQIQPYMPASSDTQSGGSIRPVSSGPNINIGPFNNVDVDPLHLASRIAFEYVDPMVVT